MFMTSPTALIINIGILTVELLNLFLKPSSSTGSIRQLHIQLDNPPSLSVNGGTFNFTKNIATCSNNFLTYYCLKINQTTHQFLSQISNRLKFSDNHSKKFKYLVANIITQQN